MFIIIYVKILIKYKIFIYKINYMFIIIYVKILIKYKIFIYKINYMFIIIYVKILIKYKIFIYKKKQAYKCLLSLVYAFSCLCFLLSA